MSTKNKPSLPQYPTKASVYLSSLNPRTLLAPQITGLLCVAGPDGTEIYEAAAIATATQTSANQIELFTSNDYGATFTYLPVTGAFTAGAAASTVLNPA